MPTKVVEIHVPLLPTPDLPDGAHPFPWIEEVEDFLSDREDQGDAEASCPYLRKPVECLTREGWY